MIDLLLVTVLVICVITDIKHRKIYNKVIYPALLAGFLLHLIQAGPLGLGYSFLGFLLGIALLFIPYALGGMGAGDVKLLGLIGALKGSAFVLQAFIYTAIFGGLIACVYLLLRTYTVQSWISRMRYKDTLQRWTSRGALQAYPYGVPIAAGVLLALAFNGGFLG